MVGYALGIEALYKAFNLFGKLNLALINNLEVLDDVYYSLRVDESNLVCIVVARILVGNLNDGLGSVLLAGQIVAEENWCVKNSLCQ